MTSTAGYSLSLVRGASLEGDPLAAEILALDRLNMGPILEAAGRPFPEERRRQTLFAPSNRIIVARRGGDLAGYIDFCDDRDNPGELYLSSIQIDIRHRHGVLFKLLIAHLLDSLQDEPFTGLRTHIQATNAPMIAMARKAGFTLHPQEGRPTLAAHAPRAILASPGLVRMFSRRPQKAGDRE